MPRKATPAAPLPADHTPLTTACAVLAKHGTVISYSSLWGLCASGRLPTVRRGARLYLVGLPADLARLVAFEMGQPIRRRPLSQPRRAGAA